MTLTETPPERLASPPPEPAGRRFPRPRMPRPRTLALLVTAAVVVYLVAAPLAILLRDAFVKDGSLSFGGFSRALGESGVGSTLWNTVVFAIGSTLLGMGLGTVLAYLSTRTNAPLRRLVYVSSIIPLIVPSILYAPSWVFLSSQDIGLFNEITDGLLGVRPFNVFSMEGMIWVQGLHVAPIAFLFMASAFRAMDPSLEEAARTSGATRWEVLGRVTLPLAKPALAGAGLILFVQSLEVFEIPALLGLPANIQVVTSQIYELFQSYPIDFQAVGALGVLLLVVASVGVFLAGRTGGSLKQSATVSGKAFQPRRADLGRARPYVGAFLVLYFAVVVVLPLGVLLYASLLPYYQTPGADAFASMSFDNYTEILGDPSVLIAFKNTVLVTVGAAAGVMILATITSWFVVRTRIRGRGVLDAVAFAPIIVPGLVLGLAIGFVYLHVRLPIYATLWIILIAYMTRFLPYGMRYASASMRSISPELEESAYVSGAGWLTTVRRILLPLAAPGMISGFIYVLIVGFRELQSTILLYSPGRETVSVLVWEEYQNGGLSAVAAIGVLLVLVLCVFVGLAFLIGGRKGVRVQ
ncbi:iron ABC transporter permease [Streptomyces camponoticapitis]|uniref:Iron ABC transporter permease n=1 Tax=Streptomyces camponoticapitis TaxID=1616125 RepID=A0ABQ2E495_9ACTN|nr:iron ABC transporter permease [Streptomyces camponoticapitis]GGJ91854.1 iron ABC transporter permease [Streptomyces camponoticapitis]